MAGAYESWERLVTAVLRDEDLRLTALRTPSENSSASPSPLRSWLLTGNLQSFTHHQILRATHGLNASSLIKHGQSGDLFYGTFDDGTPVVVKKIDLSLAKKQSLFRSELEVAEKLSHSRLVSFLGHCSELRNKKFLIYDYMPNKDLLTCLFGGSSSLLDWKTRLKIAIGVAECLCYLHHECVPLFTGTFKLVAYFWMLILMCGWEAFITFVLKAKTLVNMGSINPCGCESDVKCSWSNLAQQKLIIPTPMMTWLCLGGNVCMRLPSSVACRYAAPEGFTSEKIIKGMIPIANDVYGFGGVVFDVFTGVLTDQRFDTFRSVDVSGLGSITNKQIMRIINDQLKGERNAMTARELASLALKCTATDVEARPSMGQVVGKLELINLGHKATV